MKTNMPVFNPTGIYEGQSVYVIAGGTSVSEHDLTVLRDKPVIGLNQAFAVIPEIINYCTFGDRSFFDFLIKHIQKVKDFKGHLVTNAALPTGVSDYSWIETFPKEPFMTKGKSLGWYGNTGILGIELAITLGASKIYLLGYDNYNKDGVSHYHKYHKAEVKQTVLDLFQKQFTRANKVWKEDYPDVEIINLNPNSRLNMFKKKSGKRHLRKLLK